MYKLYQIGQDLYQIHPKYDGAKEGNLLAILTYSVYNLGFDPNELQLALLDMLDNEVDAAEFGANRTFLYSFNRRKAS